jgi:trigger factor
MKTKVEDLSSVKKRLFVEIEPEELEKRLNKVYSELKKRVRLKGFRPGKVPIKILETRFGDIVKQEVIDDIIKSTFPEAVKELNTLPLAVPSFEYDKDSLRKGQPFQYSAIVEVKPEIEVKDYIGIELKKPKVEVTEEMVENELKKIREMHGEIVPISEQREIKNGDYVRLNYQAFYKGKPLENLKKENALIKVGARDTHPLFEAGLVGLKKGDETTISVDFEENYPNPELAGKNIKFVVQILEINEMKLPELTDDFVKEKLKLGSVEELKEQIRKKLLEQEEKKAESELKRKILDYLVDKVEMEIPEALIEAELENMIENFKIELRMGGSNLEAFGLTEEKLREDFRSGAEKRVRQMLILSKIADNENIEVSEEELDEEIKKIADMTGKEPDELKKLYEERNLIGYLRVRLREQKTLNYLLQNAKIIETQKESSNAHPNSN